MGWIRVATRQLTQRFDSSGHNSRPRSPRLARDRLTVVQHVDEADGEHPLHGRVSLQRALHPVLVLRARRRHDDDVALLERQFVLVVGLTVVESFAPRRPRHRRLLQRLLQWTVEVRLQPTTVGYKSDFGI
jgi:hypothetical protein